jgi:hypothetical protein
MGIASRTRKGQSSGSGQRSSRGLRGQDTHTPSLSSSSTARTAAKTRSSTTDRISNGHDGVKLDYPNIESKESSEDIIPEIIVSIDNMEFLDVDMDSDSNGSVSPPPDDEKEDVEKMEGVEVEEPMA